MALNVVLAVLGWVMVSIGAGMVFLPAGIILGGFGLIGCAYVKAYLEVRSQ